MASGHVYRANRPNTWPHRPSLRREDSSCQPGAVHTWPEAAQSDVRSHVGNWGITRLVMLTVSFVDPDPSRRNGDVCSCVGYREQTGKMQAWNAIVSRISLSLRPL